MSCIDIIDKKDSNKLADHLIVSYLEKIYSIVARLVSAGLFQLIL
jgi:hypothetical protein